MGVSRLPDAMPTFAVGMLSGFGMVTQGRPWLPEVFSWWDSARSAHPDMVGPVKG